MALEDALADSLAGIVEEPSEKGTEARARPLQRFCDKGMRWIASTTTTLSSAEKCVKDYLSSRQGGDDTLPRELQPAEKALSAIAGFFWMDALLPSPCRRRFLAERLRNYSSSLDDIEAEAQQRQEKAASYLENVTSLHEQSKRTLDAAREEAASLDITWGEYDLPCLREAKSAAQSALSRQRLLWDLSKAIDAYQNGLESLLKETATLRTEVGEALRD